MPALLEMPTLDIHSPLQDAVEQMAARTVVGSPMASREWELLPAEVRLRSMFSARVEHERTLSEMQARITDALAGRKRDGVTMDKGRFVEEMRKMVRATGYKRPEGTHRKSVQNLKSRARLELIWEINVAQARGYAKWLADMTPEGLENEPCQELVRVQARMEPRDWQTVWRNAGGEFYDGRMIAKKTDPIWVAISRFGVPWAPFDWGSGMGLAGIDIDEAEALGAVSPEDPPLIAAAVPFNAAHSASAANIPEAGLEALRSQFGDAIKLDSGRLRLQRHLTPETDEQRKLDITESLRQRARRQYLEAGDQFSAEFQRTDDGAAVGDRLQEAREFASIYLAQAAAVAVGRKQVFHDTMPPLDQEAFVAACRAAMPEVEVAVVGEYSDILVWRRDIARIDPEELVAAMHDGRGGLMLGYGLDSPAWVKPGPHVKVQIYRMPRADGDLPMAGFDAPVESWRTYARARARDLEDAMGIGTFIEWEVRP